uniref:Uncharacterized protein n=1 Tax=Arundo donax TaxID=35708 RepID=A0A0A9DV50_ARUDO
MATGHQIECQPTDFAADVHRIEHWWWWIKEEERKEMVRRGNQTPDVFLLCLSLLGEAN